MAANVPSRVQDALDRARNEQQKFILLAFVVAQERAVPANSSKAGFEPELVSRCCAVGFATLNTDLGLALTFAYIATHSGDDFEKRCRNLNNVRKALDSVARISGRLGLSDDDARQLEDKSTFLRRVLDEDFP